MRTALPPLLVSLVLAGVGSLAWAQGSPSQSVAAVPAPAATAPGANSNTIDPLIERIRIEDRGSRIDELRVGGETKSITVQPKDGMPAYEVQPVTGARAWKILSF